MPKEYFPRVREAREALKAKALELYAQYLAIIEEARAKGEFEVALEHTKWLIEHMPAEEGERMVDPSTDKGPGSGSGQSGPTIQIGIALTPPERQSKALPKVIDIKKLNE